MDNKLSHFVFDKLGVSKYQSFLDLASFRHKLISGNIANVSTPGYKTREIDFEKEFVRATGETSSLPGAITHSRHLPLGTHEKRPPRVHETRPRGTEMNAVDIDREVTSLAENELRFTVAARILKQKFEGLRKAITSK
jgi:flagellar basal-body rod protein FlgB